MQMLDANSLPLRPCHSSPAARRRLAAAVMAVAVGIGGTVA
ncbi:MAG: hypothetical protein JWO31_3681, partial [Phycisphaerales bacterium]|nr:hypothetical protein [Phycisphaerales bacterium]